MTKKIVYSILITTISILLSSCAWFAEKENDITNYGEFFERSGSISEYLVFPKQIPDSAANITYKSLWNDVSLIDPTIQIYLEYELNEEDYVAEVQRISEARIEEGMYQVWIDEENFVYPAYVATDGYSNEYEYVLMDDENYRLIYVYLWNEFRVNVKFNRKYLPDYYGKVGNDKEKRSIYWLEDFDENEFLVIYDDILYRSVNYWFPLGGYERPIEVRDYDEPDWKMKGYLFNDTKERFLYADNLYFCRNDEVLPNYQELSSIEKIVIQSINNKEKGIVIAGEEITTFIEQISDYKKKEEKLNVKKSVGVVEVYYKDYPACQWIGELLLLKNGDYAFCMYDIEKEYTVTANGVLIKNLNQ